MKATATIDKDNWLNITVEAENIEEASRIVKLALARNADADKVAQFYLDTGVKCYVTLLPRKDNMGNWVSPSSIPKVKI